MAKQQKNTPSKLSLALTAAALICMFLTVPLGHRARPLVYSCENVMPYTRLLILALAGGVILSIAATYVDAKNNIKPVYIYLAATVTAVALLLIPISYLAYLFCVGGGM